MLIQNNKRPLNESETHYELKQIAKYILKSRGYSIIGEEIAVSHSSYLYDYPQFKQESALGKQMIDVIGLQLKGTFYFSAPWGKHKDYYFEEPKFKSIGFESKASLEDFKNGFCCTPEKTYIIAPIRVIPKELIPKDIGLFEVDLDNYKIIPDKHIFKFEGVYETVKPKIRIDKYFIEDTKPIDNSYYQQWCKDVLRYIGYVRTNQDIYKDNQIIINSKKWKGNK